VLVGSGTDPGPHDAVIGEVLWATLRGLVMAQMLTPRPLDSSRERAVLVELITTYLDRVGTGR